MLIIFGELRKKKTGFEIKRRFLQIKMMIRREKMEINLYYYITELMADRD